MNDSDHYCRLKLELTKVQIGLKLKKFGHALNFLFFVHNFFQFLSTHETNFAHYSILNLPPSLLREKKNSLVPAKLYHFFFIGKDGFY